MLIENFNPLDGTTNIAVTAVSQDLTLPTAKKGGANALRLVNFGTQIVFWKKGAGGASVSTSTPLLPNTSETFEIEPGNTIIAVIAPAGGSTLYATTGKGS